MSSDSSTGTVDDRGDKQQGQPRRLTLEEFKSLCRAELNWLVTEYGFQEDLAQPVNPFTVQFVRDDLIIVVEGIMWGDGAILSIGDHQGRSIYLSALDPAFVPSTKPSRRAPKGQAADIARHAQRLRTLGTRLLEGDFTVFEDAIARDEATRTAPRIDNRLNLAVQEAVAAFRLEQWPRVVELLEPHEAELSPRVAKKLAVARQKLGE